MIFLLLTTVSDALLAKVAGVKTQEGEKNEKSCADNL